MPQLTPAFESIAKEAFVSLATFRRTGVPVATPLWVAADDGALIFTTPEGTGKLKRLRNNPVVEMRPCGRLGKVKEHAPTVRGVAEIITGEEAEKHLEKAFRAKYKLQYSIVMGIERRTKMGQRRRVMLRVTPE